MWWHLLLECIEADEREAGIVENSRRRLIEGRVVAVRRKRDAWLAAQNGGGSSSGVTRKGHEAAGQRTAEGLVQLAQRRRSKWLVCMLSKMKPQSLTGEILDMLTCWRRSVQLESMAGASQMVTAVEMVSKPQFRKQRSKWMREFAADGGEMQYLQMETAEGTSGRT